MHRLTFLIGLAAMAAALGLAVATLQPPALKPVTAPAHEFSAVRAWSFLDRLVGDNIPHPVGTQANARVGAAIVAELTALSYPVETQATFACRAVWATCGYVENIMTRLPGRTDGPAVMITAHYDSVGAGPGAGDDMSGVAIILEIARMLRAEGPLRNPITFLLSDGEEVGLLGAEAFVAEHPWADEVGVVINLEARGTGGQSVLFETTEDNAWLIEAYTAHAPRPVVSSVYEAVYELLPNDSDLSVYEEAGMAGVNFGFIAEAAHYHTPLDAVAQLDPRSLQHHGDNALALVRAFGDMDLTQPSTGKHVSLDILPGVIVHWPEPWTIWLALAGLVVWVALAVFLIRRGELTVRALAWGMGAWLIGMLAAMLLGWAVALLISRLSGLPAPWYAYTMPSRVAFWSSALLIMTLVATLMAPRAGFWGAASGVWVWWAVLSLALAWWMPGVSVLTLLPTLFAAVLLAGVGLTPLRALPYTRAIAAGLALFGGSMIGFSLALGAEEPSAGPELGAIVAFAVAFAASGFLPFLALPHQLQGLRRGLTAATAVVMVAAAVVALRMPPYSDHRPQRLNLLHAEDRSSGAAYWLVDGDHPSLLPDTLRQAGDFDPNLVEVLPWSRNRFVVSESTPGEHPAPEIEVISDGEVAGARVVDLQIRSPRRGDWLALYIPETAALQRITLPETSHVLDAELNGHDFYQFLCYGAACDGVRVTLHMAHTGPLDLWVVDHAYGLPPDGAILVEARPPRVTPVHAGDITLIGNRAYLDGL